MDLRHIIKPTTLFVAAGLPASAGAVTTLDVDYTATSGTGTQITIGAAASPQFNFNIQPSGAGGTKSYLNANNAGDPTARIGFPGSPPIYFTANTSADDTSADFFTNGDYSLAFSIGSQLYNGFATVDREGRHISRITYDLAGAPVPEPATWALTIVGMGLAGAALRRRRREAIVSAAA